MIKIIKIWNSEHSRISTSQVLKIWEFKAFSHFLQNNKEIVLSSGSFKRKITFADAVRLWKHPKAQKRTARPSRSPRPRRRWFVVRIRPSEMGTFASSLVDPKEERRQRHWESDRTSRRIVRVKERDGQGDVWEKNEGSVEGESLHKGAIFIWLFDHRE